MTWIDMTLMIRSIPLARPCVRSLLALSSCVLLTCLLSSLTLAQEMPGFVVSTYAVEVADPVNLAFAPDTTLYVGRDTPSGGSTPVRIHRVEWPGSPVTEYGNTTIPDPDYVAYDRTGALSGVPGSVLVGSGLGATTGRISAIHSDGVVVTVFESTAYPNPTDMILDIGERLLFGDQVTRRVFSSTGATPAPLFTVPVGDGYPISLAVDPANRIYVSTSTGKVQIYNSDGTLVDADFVSFSGYVTIAFAPAGPFGACLYARDGVNGTLYRVDAGGEAQVAGSGFTQGGAIRFGPCGSLYVSQYWVDRILRITPDGSTAVDDAFETDHHKRIVVALPNPSRGTTVLRYEIGEASQVELSVIDATGRQVAWLRGGEDPPGLHSVTWDGRNMQGLPVPSGVYFVRAAMGSVTVTQRLVLVR